ncbi:hypothetical protein AB2709_25710 [Klebsiella quasipneumoniae]|uniref:hypothetical protein n=1 Tax=Klebsiella quasipneumoniae TaxID=1463165 RepID=UPI003463B2EF
MQRAEVADGLQLSGQMQLHKIPAMRLRQELPERGIVGCRGVLFFFIISPGSENDPGMLSQAGAAHNGQSDDDVFLSRKAAQSIFLHIK